MGLNIIRFTHLGHGGKASFGISCTLCRLHPMKPTHPSAGALHPFALSSHHKTLLYRTGGHDHSVVKTLSILTNACADAKTWLWPAFVPPIYPSPLKLNQCPSSPSLQFTTDPTNTPHTITDATTHNHRRGHARQGHQSCVSRQCDTAWRALPGSSRTLNSSPTL
jgi:hypothetical protein